MTMNNNNIPECCKAPEVDASVFCPQCKNKGKVVKGITILSLVSGEKQRELESTEGFRFCVTQSCDLAYFHPKTGTQISKNDVTVRIGVKEVGAPRAVCYCFNHSVESIEEEIRVSGQSSAPSSITENCRSGLERCSELNPKGSCCLGDVNKIIRKAQEQTKRILKEEVSP